SNWLVEQASIVQWPELCGRVKISLRPLQFYTTGPSVARLAPYHLGLDPLHRAGPHAEPFRHLQYALAGCQPVPDGVLHLAGHLWATQSHALGSRPIQSCVDPASDWLALELSEGAADAEEHPARWRGRVDGLLVQEQVNAGAFQRPQRVDQVRQ